jgi:putative serine protease PepD
MNTQELPPEPPASFVPPPAPPPLPPLFAQFPPWLRRLLGWGLLAVFLVGLGGLIGGRFALWPGPERAVSAATVWVRVGDGGREGSGVLISRDGLVLTAAHVVAGAGDGELRVTLYPGTRRALDFPARLTSWAGKPGAPRPEEMAGDWAILRADVVVPVPCLGLSEADASDGSRVYVAGITRRRPDAAPAVTVETGALTAALPGPDGASLAYNTDARIQPGMSGGPCTDATGRIIGLCVMYSHEAPANLILPVGRFREACRRAIAIYGSEAAPPQKTN